MRYLMAMLLCATLFAFTACETAQKEEEPAPEPVIAERTTIEELPTPSYVVDHTVGYSMGMYLPVRVEIREHHMKQVTTVTKVEIDPELSPEEQKVISKKVTQEMMDSPPVKTTKSVFIHREQYDTFMEDWHDAQMYAIEGVAFSP